MNNNLADIVNVTIDLETPALDLKNFGNILIIGPEVQGVDEVAVYSSYKAASSDGIVCVSGGEVVADPVGIGVAAAFSQNPRPDKVYVANRKKINAGKYIKFIDSSNELTKEVTVEVPSGEGWTTEITATNNGQGENVPVIPVGGSGNRFAFSDGTLTIVASATKNGVQFTATATCTIESDEVAIETEYNEAYESWTDLLDKANSLGGWYCVCPVGISESDYAEIATWVEANEKICCFNVPRVDISNSDYVGMKNKMRSFGICNLERDDTVEIVNELNKAANCAWAAKCLSYYPGQETWALKTLNGIEPITINDKNKKIIKEGTEGNYNGVYSFYTVYASKKVTQGGMTFGGEWIDVIRGRDWLESEMQTRIFSVLCANPKVPYTDEGITLIQNQMIAALKHAQTRGVVAPDEYDENNEPVPGFTTYAPLAVNIAAAQKMSRKLVDIGFAARIAGAIHVVEVKGSLTYDIN